MTPETKRCRKEQIEQAALELVHGCEGEDYYFIQGAEWADENPIEQSDKPQENDKKKLSDL